MNNADLFDRAKKRWGVVAVEISAVEECSELIKALTKIQRYRVAKMVIPSQKMLDLIDELADVSICVERLIQTHKVGDKVAARIKKKLMRLASRVRDRRRGHP